MRAEIRQKIQAALASKRSSSQLEHAPVAIADTFAVVQGFLTEKSSGKWARSPSATVWTIPPCGATSKASQDGSGMAEPFESLTIFIGIT